MNLSKVKAVILAGGYGSRLSEETGYSVGHLSNVTSLKRRVNNTIANAMYNLTSRRVKNAEYAQA